MKKSVALAAALEAVTGLALMFDPSLVARLLLGDDLTGVGTALGRVAGFGLFALGLACWPTSKAPSGVGPGLWALLTYNLLVTMYLLYLAIASEWVGSLLWPGVALHAVLTLLLAGVVRVR